VMTALTKFQHVCMREMRVTESSVRVSLLPGQLGELHNSNPSGAQTWKKSLRNESQL
jgi:hypothetical protein